MKNNRINLVFLITPILLLVFILLALNEMTRFYFGWYDPVYAYLMNGLTFASGSIDIGHTDHPGTPLQIICAVIIKITSWLRGTDNLVIDVIKNPEIYIFSISISLILINCVGLYFLGVKTYHVTRNRAVSLIIQLVPLLSLKAVYFMPIVATESLLMFLSVLLAILIIHFSNVKSEIKPYSFVYFALISALILSTKISALPVLAIPFFFIKGIKKKLYYSMLTLALALLFVSPVLGKMHNFLTFIEGIFTHSGKYGVGEEMLFDWSTYSSSLMKIFFQEIPFTLHLILLFIAWGVLYKRPNVLPKLRRIILGLTVSTLLGIIVVARHYSFHYLIPIYVIAMPLQVYFWYLLYRDKIEFFKWKKYQWLLVLIILLVFTRLVLHFHFYPEMKTPVVKTASEIEKNYSGTYVILTDGSNGTAFYEPALRFGLAYSGSEVRSLYKKIVSDNYSGNYTWNERDGLSNWSGNVLMTDLFSANDSLYIYNRSFNCEKAFSRINEMIEFNGLKDLTNTKKVYENSISGEVIVLSINDTSKVKEYNIPDENIFVSMENRSVDYNYFVSDSGFYFFEGGKAQTDKIAFDGNYSLLLTSSNPFGLKIALPAKLNDRFRLSVWQKSLNGKEALIVASAINTKKFYKTSQGLNDKAGEWHKRELVFSVPKNYIDSIVNFYLWLPDKDSVWIDDFKIERFFQ